MHLLALEVFKSAAEFGSVTCQYELGTFYLLGSGIVRNYVQEAKYFKIAAEAGDLDALVEYGCCWIYGWGVETNEKYGLTLLRAAATLGSISAMNELGDVLRQVEKSSKESFHWLYKAALKKDLYAMDWVGKCLIEGIGVERDVRKVRSTCATLA